MKKTLRILVIFVMTIIGLNGIQAKYTCSCSSINETVGWSLEKEINLGQGKKEELLKDELECNEEVGIKSVTTTKVNSGSSNSYSKIKSIYYCKLPVVDENEYGITCKYDDKYFTYSSKDKYGKYEFKSNFVKEENIGRKAVGLMGPTELTWLYAVDMISKEYVAGDDNITFTCPTKPFGLDLGVLPVKSCGDKNSCVVELDINDIELSSDGIGCLYKDINGLQHYVSISAPTKATPIEIESDFPGLNGTFGKLSEYKTVDFLKQKGLIKSVGSDYEWTCPLDSSSLGIGGLIPVKRYCENSNCSLKNIESGYDGIFTCIYESTTTNNVITVNVVDTADKNEVLITYPDGSVKKTNIKDLGWTSTNKNCEDIYYVSYNNDLALASTKQNEQFDSKNSWCNKYFANQIEHFCSNGCDYEDFKCDYGEKSNVSCGSTTGIPIALPIFIRNIINIIKIVVPIIIIILGMLDFGKATYTQDEKVMKTVPKKIVTRIAGGLLIFIITSIVQFIFGAIGHKTTNDMVSCVNCFINGVCVETPQNSQPEQTHACWECSSNKGVYVWSLVNPGASASCTGGYKVTDKSKEECYSTSEKYEECKKSCSNIVDPNYYNDCINACTK